MKKLFTLFFVAILLVTSISVVAQEKSEGGSKTTFTASNENKTISTNYNYEGTNSLLWDNFVTVTTSGIISSLYGGLPAGANIVNTADDFVVPAFATWTITEVVAPGFYNPVVLADSFGVDFYANNAGLPGTLIAHRSVVTSSDTAKGVFATPVVLTAGSYWVSVYAMSNTATALASFRWNWYTSSQAVGTEAALQDLGSFFGGIIPWTYLSGLGVTGAPSCQFQIYGTAVTPCPVTAPTNPSPANGTLGLPITGNTATWVNGAATTNVEVWFGQVGSLVLVYDGPAISSLSAAPLEPLNYNTQYAWKIVCKDASCYAEGPVWTFKTMRDPSTFLDDFESGLSGWTVDNGGGTCVWESVLASSFSFVMPPTASGNVAAANSDGCGSGTTMNTTLTLTNGVNLSMYSDAFIEFDSDFNDYLNSDDGYLDVSVDGGTVWTNVLHYAKADFRTTHVNLNISAIAAGQANVKVRFKYTAPDWDWWWAIDNVTIYGLTFTPVELTSFAAKANDNNVNLNWSTATETNNSGFQIERSNGNTYEVVGFVAGHGTTTEINNYSFVDQNLSAGNYTYRLKQVDFDGSFEYSQTVAAEVSALKVFALEQNYPNPFNPSTTIKFNLAVDSKVSLKIFDILGQEVATLINGQLTAGAQKVDFNASSLNSGVYIYKIEASGLDGQKFISTKKMVLTK